MTHKWLGCSWIVLAQHEEFLLCPSDPYSVSARLGNKLGWNIARTAILTWSKGYSLPDGIVLSNTTGRSCWCSGLGRISVCLWEVVTDCFCIILFHFLHLLNCLSSWPPRFLILFSPSCTLSGPTGEKAVVMWGPAATHHNCSMLYKDRRKCHCEGCMWHLPGRVLEIQSGNIWISMNYCLLKQMWKNAAVRLSCLSLKNYLFMNHTQNFKSLQATMTSLLLVQLRASE